MIPATAAAAKAAAEGAMHGPAAAADGVAFERNLDSVFTSAHVVSRVGEPGGKGACSKGECRSSPYGAGPSYYAVPKACVQPNPTPAPKAEPDPEPASWQVLGRLAGQLAGPTPSSTPAPKPAPTPPTRVQDLEDTQDLDEDTLEMGMGDTQQGAEESSADEFWNGIEG